MRFEQLARRLGGAAVRSVREPRLLVEIAGEVARAALVLPEVERMRIDVGPSLAVPALRARGMTKAHRDPRARARLRRVIAWVDTLAPGGRGCYRRSLMAVALDAGAATEPFRMGMRAGSELVDGHAWVGDDGADPGATYDFVIEL